MRKFEILYDKTYDEIISMETNEAIFCTQLDEDLARIVGRSSIEVDVVNSVIDIWNRTETIDTLGPGGELSKYLLQEPMCSQEEREMITEGLCAYAKK